MEQALRRERPLAEALQSSRQLETAVQELERVEGAQVRACRELRTLRADVAVLDALVDLLTIWAPACLLVGVGVWGLHWASPQPGSGVRARVLTQCLLLLLALEKAGDRRQTFSTSGPCPSPS